MTKEIDYSKICFAVMPFSKKNVDGKEIDFDFIYNEVFKPAIATVTLPEGGNLIPKRTDQDYCSANIDTEMFRYLEYSRFALVDITGLNANVFYELGVRHHSQQSGTAIFRQSDKLPPFDISHIKAFPYDYEPREQITAAQELITKVLTESLEYNRIDSPVQVALQAQQQQGPKIENLLIDATNAMRHGDYATAINKYRQAIKIDFKNPVLLLELGLLYKSVSDWKQAVEVLSRAVKLSPQYSEAWRELGIVQNKEFYDEKEDPSLPDGEKALLTSIEFNKDDFDAHASLGGIYKRMKRYDEAQDKYAHSTEISYGHPYPLLNQLILQIRKSGMSSVTIYQRNLLKRAMSGLAKQVSDTLPYNAPWSFFDLATIYLILGKKQQAVTLIEDVPIETVAWQYKTFLDTMNLLEETSDRPEGYEELVTVLRQKAG